MPHATAEQQSGDDHDDILIQQLLDAPTVEDPFDLNRELEPGEKAEDAENYEDISDDDLADDEDAEGERGSQREHGYPIVGSSKSLQAFTQDIDFPALTNGNDLDDVVYDDLFGENSASPGGANIVVDQSHDQDGLSDFDDSTSPQVQPMPFPTSALSHQVDDTRKSALRPATLSSKESPPSKELQRQQELLAMSRNGATNSDGLPAPPENHEELLASLWPKFERDAIPKFMDLLPPKRARYFGKSIPKPPKPINPNKDNLELAFDQEKSFKALSTPNKPNLEESSSQGIVTIQQDIVIEKDNEEDVDMESDFENELIGGISWQDLQIICEDWDTRGAAESFGAAHSSSCCHQSSHPHADEALGCDLDNGRPSAKVSVGQFCHGKVCSQLPTATKIRPFGGQHNARSPIHISIVSGSRVSHVKDCKDHHPRSQ